MDKENNNNIEDILKLLKNTVENTGNTPADVLTNDDKAGADDINAELLKEKLREQFMSDGEKTEEINDEYTIDSELISEFYDESKNQEEAIVEAEPLESTIEEETTEEPEAEEEAEEVLLDEVAENIIEDSTEETATEPLEMKEGEIVEIIIPWVDAIEPISEGKSDQEDFGGELDDDDYDGEASDNAYICFADEDVTDEDIFEESVDEEDAILLPEENTVDEELIVVSEADSYDEEVVVLPEENTYGEDENANEDDDYLPWYEDDSQTPKEKFFDNDNRDIILAAYVEEDDSYDEEDESVKENTLQTDEIETEETEFEDTYEERAQETEEEEETLRIVEDVEERHVEEIHEEVYSKNDDDDTSFYRTILEARTQRESIYGYSSVAIEEDTLSEETLESRGVDEELSLPEFSETGHEHAEESVAYEGESDFFGVDEQDEDPDEDKTYDEDEQEPVIDFEHDAHDDDETLRDTPANAVWEVIKPIILGILALGIFVLEMIPILRIVPNGILDYTSYPWTYILIDAQLLIFMSALCYDKMFDGLAKIARNESNFYSVLSVTVIVTLLSSIISCFCANDGMPNLYNFISAVYILVLYVFERVNKKRVRESLMSLYANSVFTLRRSQGKNSCAEKMYAGGVNPDTNILEPVEVESLNFDSAFAREKVGTNKNISINLVVSSIIPIAIFSIFMAVVSTVIDTELAIAINTFTSVFVCLAPLSAIISYYFPILLSYHRLRARGCYIAGYEGAAEIADCDALVFGDCHLFRECSAKEAGIKLYCDGNKTRELFVALGAVYAKIGGPMQNTFSSVLDGNPHKVNMIRITRSGFEAVVDNRTTLIVGSSDYLSRYGIVTDRADTKQMGVIYAVMNSSLCAKISVLYKPQPLFEMLSDVLLEYGIRSVIETYDPVISGKYVAKCRETDTSSVSVVHKNVNDYNMPPKEKVAVGRSGAFVTSSRLKLVELVTFCKKLIGLRKINTAILITSYVTVAILSVLLSISGAVENVNLLWVLLYQIILATLYVVAGIKFLPLSFDAMQEKKMREENKEQEKETRYE